MIKRKFFVDYSFVPPPATGNGFFATGNTGTNLTVYNMSNDTVALSIGTFPLAGGNTNQTAAGNSVAGIYARGATSTTTYRYEYATNAVTAGGVLTFTVAASSGIGFGNDTVGIFGRGSSTNTMNKYTYAANTAAVTTNLGVTNTVRAAADGNLSVGVIVLNNGTANTNVYTYADDTVVAGGSVGINHSGGIDNSVSIATHGIFTLGQNTRKYIYASNTAAASTFLTATGNGGKGSSDGTKGIMCLCNSSAVTNKYTFAGDVVAAATSFTANQVSTSPGLSSMNPGVNF